jgi:hypothetical protein
LATQSKFPDKNELRRFARNFIKERIDSLQKDVMHCLQLPYAPFPAILYCLATIDLLGSLCYGQKNSRTYMHSFMGYTQEQSKLITQIFRHKLVHLAQPRPVFSYNKKTVAWRYVHENTPDHLILKDLPKDSKKWVKSDWSVDLDQVFTIGITQLVEDIRDSVLRHGGYLDQLDRNKNKLLNKFEHAMDEVYTP